MEKIKIRMPLAFLLVSLFIFLMVIALPAWNTSGWTAQQGKLVVNGVEAASESVSYTANMDLNENAYYMQKGHAYILEHAIELLRIDGYDNWADVARNNLLHLNSGSCHADAYKGRVEVYLQLEVLWGVYSKDLCKWDFTCVGGCEHYYTPGNGKGLNLLGWLQAAEFLQHLSKTLSAAAIKPLTFGLLNLHVQLSPDIQQQWPSGIDLCQEHYEKAVSTWKEGDLIYPGRASWESAMYELGWACHLLADQAIAQHLQNKFLGSHGGYEDLADGLGDENGEQTDREPEQNYHAENAKDVYQFSNQSTPTKLAKDLVKDISQLPNHFDKACADDQSEQLKALKGAIPLAEQYTAALIAQFMTDAGVPKKTPPLEGYVRISGGNGPLAGAYIFYGLSSVSTIEQNVNIATIDIAKNWQGWAHVRTDANGHYSISVKPNPLYRYWIRPAMPGYRWVGTTENNLEFGKKESFVTYTARSGMTSSDSISFYLSKIPKTTALVAVPLPLAKDAAVLAWNGRMQWGGRRPPIIKPETLLAQSVTAISSALAETVQRSLMKTTSDESVLEVQNGGTKLPEEAFVTISLSNLMDIVQAKTLSSTSAVLTTIDQACLNRKNIALASTGIAAKTAMDKVKPATARFMSNEQWLAVKAKLPSEQVTGKDHKTWNVYILSANAEGSEGAAMLLENGLAAIPSRGGARIEVSAVSGVGYLTDVKPVTLTTNSEGRTAFFIKAGSQAGKIRLQFKVIKNPEAVQVLPSDNLEIMVHPPLRGFDPANETAPVLVPAIMDTIQAKKITPPAPAQATFEGQVTLPALEPEPQRPERETQRLPEHIPFQPLPPAGPGARRTENFDRDPVLGWEFLGGARPAPGEAGRILDCRGEGHGVWFIEPARDFELSFRFRSGSGQGDIFFRMGGEPPQNQQYLLRLLGQDIFLSRRAKGEEKPLGSVNFTFVPGQWYPVTVLAQGQKIDVLIAGREVLSCTDPSPLPPGNVAFGCRQGQGIAFDDILLAPLEKPEPGGGEPGRPNEPQSQEIEQPQPPEPQPGEIEPPRPPEPQPREIEPPRPPELQPGDPQPPRPPEPQPSPQPQPPRQPEQVSPRQGPVDISGSWRNNRGFNFRISQHGSQFTWEVPDIAERGSGTVNGRNVTASWVGRMGSGSARGTVETAPDGRATAIRWDNGGVFQKQN